MKTFGLRIAGFLLIMALLFGIQTMVLAQNEELIYIGFSLPYNSVKGDFNGYNYLTGGGENLVLPKIEGEYGFGATVGGNLDGNICIELNYNRSVHDTFWDGDYYQATLNIIGCDLKLFLSDSTRNSAKPYFILGAGIPSLVVKNGASRDLWRGNATFTGFSYDLGGGMELRFDRHLAFTGEIIYRRIIFDTAETPDLLLPIQGQLSGSGVNYRMGITYYLD